MEGPILRTVVTLLAATGVGLLVGCGGSGPSLEAPVTVVAGGATPTPRPTPTSTPTPTPAPTATPLNTPLLIFDAFGNQVLAAQLTGVGSAYAQTFFIEQSGYNGTFSASGCSGIANTAISSDGILTLTGEAVGSCTLTVSDLFGLYATLAVSVTASSVVIQ